jgi:hypothetical protein
MGAKQSKDNIENEFIFENPLLVNMLLKIILYFEMNI